MKSTTLQHSVPGSSDPVTGIREVRRDETRAHGLAPRALPRIGFLGTGWIGRHRMEAIHRSGAAEVAMICDAAEAMAAEASAIVPQAKVVSTLDRMLEAELDGIVIATPSALHAEQSLAALESGAAVFCQKPLGRTEGETAAIVEAARRADRLLGVDLSYRFTDGLRRIRDLIGAGEIGRVFTADLVFHNAYGPDKDWFYDVARSGGGCVMDLGIHLVDLALWVLDFPSVDQVSSRLYAGGEPLGGRTDVVEDYGAARLDLSDGCAVQIACSWRLPAGREAEITATFFGTEGGLRLRNVDGSFYDFVAERLRGTSTETLSSPPDEWGGRAAVEWANRLAAGERFDRSAERLVDVARVIDRIYGR